MLLCSCVVMYWLWLRIISIGYSMAASAARKMQSQCVVTARGPQARVFLTPRCDCILRVAIL